ncbi:MAG TPA: DUF5683 domain-containing protein [Chitinophagales bacterium]|nr:DUF5683 domain-containing protein [Chitinophagales bacterium]
MIHRIVISIFLTLIFQDNFCQQVTASDSIPANRISNDSLKHHSVKRAVIQSAVIPGWGQMYNKKWWKVPIIYAGFGGLGFAIGWNAKRFRTYSDAYRLRVDGDTATIDPYADVYSESNLIILKNYYKRNMNLAIIFTGVLYALNLVDAAVDAHLFEYDISDDLSLRIEPQFHFTGGSGIPLSGLNMCMRF